MNNATPLDEDAFWNLSTRIFATGDSRYNTCLGYALIGAASRMKRPGCQCDSMIVLCGPQGVGKSSFIRDLYDQKYVRSQMPALDNKDASEALNGFAAIELAELDRILRSENSTVKEFLTRTFDDYRPPYGRVSQRFPRQCTFWGTTNEDDWLRDVTGARRFWPIPVNSVDLAYTRENRKAIWKRAFMYANARAQYWFDDDHVLDDLRAPLEERDIWTDKVEKYLENKTEVRLADVYSVAVSVNGVASAGRKEQLRIAGILRRLGWSKCHTRFGKAWTKAP
jgi:predicted P-loop ATPase